MVELKDGQAILFRTAPIVLSPKGHDYSRTGVPPDVTVRDARSGQKDAILQAAIELARGKTVKKRPAPGSPS